jgi:flagellar hook-associated protein 2
MATGVTSVDGLFSGLDTTSIIKALADIQARPITILNRRVTERTSALTDYRSLSATVLALQASASSLADGNAFRARTVNVSDSSVVLASAGSGAAVGTYEVVVDRLAEAHKVASGKVVDSEAALGFAGDIRINSHVISLAAGDDLLAMRDAINQAGAGVSAAILTISDTDHRLVLTSLQTGTENAIDLLDANDTGFLQRLGLLDATGSVRHPLTDGMASSSLSSKEEPIGTVLGLSVPPAGTVTINGTAVAVDLATDSLQGLADRITAALAGATAVVASSVEGGETSYRLEVTGHTGIPTLGGSDAVLQALGLRGYGIAHELQAAGDALIHVDEYAVQRPTNQMDDVIDGVSLDLLKSAPSDTVLLNVAPNPEAAVTALQQLVNSYNTVNATINQGLQFDTETNEGGAFFADYSIVSIQAGLFSAALDPVATLGGSRTLPAELGLSVDENGLLSLDAEKLRSALAADPDGVLRLLTTRAEASNDEVEVTASTADTRDSGAAGYAVEISQVATLATARSAELGAGIAQTETLTIGGRYNVTLHAGDTLQTAADRLNTVFEGNQLAYTATVVGSRIQVQNRFYGSHYSVRIASSLNQGVGGTDLGGATAGAERAYTGQDVAGTIGGSACEGWGQWLTATGGAAKGLKLEVSGTMSGSRGVVQVSKGLASRLAAYGASLSDSKVGTLTQATQDVDDTIDSLNEEIARIQKSVDSYTENLRSRFTSAETVLARNSTVMAYLNSQFGTTTSGNSGSFSTTA